MEQREGQGGADLGLRHTGNEEEGLEKLIVLRVAAAAR